MGIRHTAALLPGLVLLAMVIACGGEGPSEADIDATVQARVQAVVEATALSIPTVTPVSTVTPIPTTPTATSKPAPPTLTPAADEVEEDVTCTLNGGEVVQKGWSGKDTGANYCNQCMCLNAGLACTKMACPSVKLSATSTPVPPTTAPASLSTGTSIPVPATATVTATPTPGQAAPTPTHTPAPTISPTPTMTATPALQKPYVVFGDGTWLMSDDIVAGTYETPNKGGGCYWARLSGLGGEVRDIIANEYTEGRTIVTFQDSDKAFESQGCGEWQLLQPNQQQSAVIEDGTWVVNDDITAGIYQASNLQGLCYWARLSGFSGELDDIVANGADKSRMIVEIKENDTGFTSTNCGQWTPLESTDALSTSFSDGTWVVGDDVVAGTYVTPNTGDYCYWARLSGFGGELDDIKANGVPTGQAAVTIEEDDIGFSSSGCGTWTILEATPTPIPTATPTVTPPLTPAPTFTPIPTPGATPTKLALMEDRIRQGVTILTADNTSGFKLPAFLWDFRFGGAVVEEVKLSVSYPSLPNHLCDGLVYEVSRVEKTIWIAFFLTVESTESGWFARFGGDGPITKSYRAYTAPPFNCHRLFPDAAGTTEYFHVPVFLGSEESYPYLTRGYYTVITNYGFLGETYTHELWVP